MVTVLGAVAETLFGACAVSGSCVGRIRQSCAYLMTLANHVLIVRDGLRDSAFARNLKS